MFGYTTFGIGRLADYWGDDSSSNESAFANADEGEAISFAHRANGYKHSVEERAT